MIKKKIFKIKSYYDNSIFLEIIYFCLATVLIIYPLVFNFSEVVQNFSKLNQKTLLLIIFIIVLLLFLRELLFIVCKREKIHTLNAHKELIIALDTVVSYKRDNLCKFALNYNDIIANSKDKLNDIFKCELQMYMLVWSISKFFCNILDIEDKDCLEAVKVSIYKCNKESELNLLTHYPKGRNPKTQKKNLKESSSGFSKLLRENLTIKVVEDVSCSNWYVGDGKGSAIYYRIFNDNTGETLLLIGIRTKEVKKLVESNQDVYNTMLKRFEDRILIEFSALNIFSEKMRSYSI